MRVAESIVILRPMRQVGCASASSRVMRSKVSRARLRNGPARGGEQQPPHVLRPPPVEALVERAVLAVDRQEPRAASPAPGRASARRPSPASPCWRARRPCRPRARGRSGRGRPPRRPRRRPWRPRGGSRPPPCPARRPRPACPRGPRAAPRAARDCGVGHRDDLRAVLRDLPGEDLDVPPAGEAHDLEPAGKRVDDPQHVRADRARRAEDGKAFHFRDRTG